LLLLRKPYRTRTESGERLRGEEACFLEAAGSACCTGTGGPYSESRPWVEIEESAGQLDGLKETAGEELFVISKSCCMMAATLHLRVKVLDGGEEVA
jgi:hypothetical protein